MRFVVACVASCVCLFGCAPSLERQLLTKPIYVARTDTLWLVERETSPSTADRVAVIVCHREATPACIRVIPLEARDSTDYARWVNSIDERSTARQARDARAQQWTPRPQPTSEPAAVTAPPPAPAPPSASVVPAEPAPSPPVPRAPDNPY